MGVPSLPKPPSLGGQGQGGGGMQSQMMQQQLAYGLSGQMMNQMMGGGRDPFANPSLMKYGSSALLPPTPNLAGMNRSVSPASATSTDTGVVPDTSSHAAFIQSMAPVAQAWEAKTGIPSDIFLAINANEGNWGGAGNSLFGIKAPGDAGSISSPTWESVNGQRVNTTDSFGQYSSPDASYQAFWNLVSTSPRYASAMAALQTGDTNGFLQGLVNGGYATDQSWGNKIQNIARTTIDPMLSAG